MRVRIVCRNLLTRENGRNLCEVSVAYSAGVHSGDPLQGHSICVMIWAGHFAGKTILQGSSEGHGFNWIRLSIWIFARKSIFNWIYLPRFLYVTETHTRALPHGCPYSLIATTAHVDRRVIVIPHQFGHWTTDWSSTKYSLCSPFFIFLEFNLKFPLWVTILESSTFRNSTVACFPLLGNLLLELHCPEGQP